MTTLVVSYYNNCMEIPSLISAHEMKYNLFPKVVPTFSLPKDTKAKVRLTHAQSGYPSIVIPDFWTF